MQQIIRSASPGGGAIGWEDVKSQISDAMTILLGWAKQMPLSQKQIHGNSQP